MKAYILAGGFSRRFGSDKTLFKVEGKPLVVSLYEKLSAYFPTFVVTKPSKVETLRLLGLRRILVDVFEIQTPLVGVITALEHAGERAVVFSADLPLLCEEYLLFLKSYKFIGNYLGYVPILDGKMHFICAVYEHDFKDLAVEGLKKGVYSLKAYSKYFKFWNNELKNVPYNCCFNLNTPEDLTFLKAKGKI